VVDGVRIQLLGGFGVELPDGRQAGPWQRPIARRLVQLLAIAPSRRAGREQIAEALFANLAPARAANAVSKAATMARSALAPYDVIEADREGVWLSDRWSIEVDVDALRDLLEAALAMPSGKPREHHLRAALSDRRQLLDDELYSDWTVEARERLAVLRIRATAALAAEADTAEAWSDLVACDPTNEWACVQLMRAYVADGRRDRAVRTFHRTTAALAHELDVDPSAAFMAEAGELLAEPALARPRLQLAVPAPVRAVGRELQIDQVVASVRASRSVLVSGPAGIGKSLLLDHVTHRLADEGWTVCHGVAVPGDRRAPYAALRAALRGLDATNLPLVTELMDERERPAAPRLAADRARLVDEIADGLDANAWARRILVVLDDLQWMDDALHDVLGRLAVRADGSRWSLLLAGRDDEPAAPLPDLPSRVGRFALGPLTESELRDVLGGLDLDDRALADVVRRSAGNPFFAIELARHGRDHPPGSHVTPERIAALIGNRLRGCSPAARQLAAVVALAGNDATYELVVQMGDAVDLAGSPQAAIAALDELVAAHLAVETEHGVRLAHPLVVDTALDRLNRVRRGALHDRLATALESTGELQTAARHRLAAFEAARLAMFAGPAVRSGYLAGRHARSLFADEVAIELLRGATAAFEAVTEPDRDEFRHHAVAAHAEIGDILLDDGDVAGAEAAYHAGLALATTDAERERVWSAIGGLHYRGGDLTAAVAAYRRGLASLTDRSTAGARLESDLAWSLWRLGETAEALDLLQRATGVLEHIDRHEAAMAFDRLAVALARAGRQQEASAAWQRGLDLASAEGDPRLIGVLHFHAGCMLVDAGRWAEGLVEVELAQHFRAGSTDLYLTALTHSVRADCLSGLGRLEEALAARELECEQFDTLGNLRQLAVALAGRAVLLDALGRPADGERYAAAALQAARECSDPDRVTQVEQVLAAPVPRRPA
jgi:DNA-binding SARP family transcriptional activator